MATRTISNAGGNWNATASWVEGVIPTAADDVVATVTSGNITINIAPFCRSADFTNYVGTLVHNSGLIWNIGDGTAGAGNIALKFVAGMTYTVLGTSTSNINFVSTATGVQTIVFAGKTTAGLTFNGVGGSWQLQDASNIFAVATVTLTAGTLNTNGQTCSWGAFSSSNANVRTLTLGASAINLNGNSVPWQMSINTNLTFSAGSSTITVSQQGANFFPGTSTAQTYNNVVFTNQLTTILASSSLFPATFANLTFAGGAFKTGFLTLNGNIIVTGTFSITGQSAINRVLLNGNIAGTPRTITAATVVASNVDFQDINGAGTAAPFTGTSLGDALGNSGITFDAPVTQTHTGSAGGNWSDATKWTSRVPLPQDDVVVDVNTTGTLTADMPRLGKSIDFTGFGGIGAFSSTPNSFYGSFTLASGMTFPAPVTITASGRSTHTLTSAGKTFGGGIVFTAPGGTYTLQDALVSGFSVQLVAGTLNTNGMTVTVGSVFQSVGALTRALNLGTSTINLLATGASTIWNIAASGLTFSGASSTIVITTASSSTRTFTGAGLTYGTLTYTVANSPGSLTITGANTFNNFNIGSGRILTMPSSTVNTINSGGAFNVSGVNNGYLYLPAVASNYVSVPDSAALRVTGDLEIMVRVAMDIWAPTSATYVGKYVGPSPAYRLYNTSGTLQLRVSLDGVTEKAYASTAAVTATPAGTTQWVRVTRIASTGATSFYTAPDSISIPVVWTQLGTTVVANPGNIFAGTDGLSIGGDTGGTNNMMAAKFYRTIIFNGIGGTPVFNADFTTKPFGANSFTESSTNAATVSINGTLAQAGDGRVSLVSSTPGTPATLSKSSGTVSANYLSIQDSTATGGASWFAGASSVNVSGNSGWIFVNAPGTGQSSNFLPFFGGSF